MKKCLSRLAALLIAVSMLMSTPVFAAEETQLGPVANISSRLNTQQEKEVYLALKAEIQKIASGEAASTDITIHVPDATRDNVNPVDVVSVLLYECPYDLYWYNKNQGCSTTISSGSVRFQFAVAEAYTKAGPSGGTGIIYRPATYQVDTDKTGAVANTIPAAARKIVAANAGKSDYAKLLAYKEAICGLVSYDYAVAENPPAYGDYWQVPYVFDGDPKTNVVCEGYAKAFQYLCDLTDFDDPGTACYIVSGDLGVNTPHMWNTVILGDKSYIVDLTNCDDPTTGSKEPFLAGLNTSPIPGDSKLYLDSYTFYEFDEDTTYTYGVNSLVVNLSTSDYEPDASELPQGHTHTYGGWTSNVGGTHSRSCTDSSCDEKETVNCSYGAWMSNDNGTHSRSCTVCGGKETASCSYAGWTPNHNGTHSRSCSVCRKTEMADCEYTKWTSNGNGGHTGSCSVCKWVGTADCSYGEWTSNGDGTHSRSCIVCNTKETHSCDYQNGECRTCGSEGLKITQQPQDVIVTAGERAVFHVYATGSGTLTYQWQVRETDSGAWREIDGATSASYTIPNVTKAMDGRQYRCVVRSAAAKESLDSNPATLTVTEAEKPAPATFQVTLNLNGGGTINSGTVTSYTQGEGAQLPSDVTREGYTFRGWYENPGCTGNAVTEISASDSGNKTFYAKWEKVSWKVNIFESSGGKVTLISGKTTYQYGDTVELEVTANEGHQFDEWDVTYQDNTSNQRRIEVKDNTFAMPTYDVTVIAKFTEKTSEPTPGEPAGPGTEPGVQPDTPDSGTAPDDNPGSEAKPDDPGSETKPDNPDSGTNPEPEKPAQPSGGSSSSSSSSGTRYDVEVESASHGEIRVSPSRPTRGQTVTITVDPDNGYVLDELIVTDSNGDEVTVRRSSDTRYTFTQPRGDVTIEATFIPETAETTFADVPADFWAYDEIEWAYDNGYVNGTSVSTFSPNTSISRQQVWMILARLSGADPANMAAAREWAMESDISDGSNPGAAVTRQQLAALLFRFARSNGYDSGERGDLSRFPDAGTVSSYAVEAFRWAAGTGVIGGTSQGTLNPAGTATRAQFAVMLYRFWSGK